MLCRFLLLHKTSDTLSAVVLNATAKAGQHVPIQSSYFETDLFKMRDFCIFFFLRRFQKSLGLDIPCLHIPFQGYFQNEYILFSFQKV